MNCFGCVYSLNEWGLCGRGLKRQHHCPHFKAGLATTPQQYDKSVVIKSNRPYPRLFDLRDSGVRVFNAYLNTSQECGLKVLSGYVVYEILGFDSNRNLLDELGNKLRQELPRRTRIRNLSTSNSSIHALGKRFIRVYVCIVYRRHNPRQGRRNNL